jgi:hypothetical protein
MNATRWAALFLCAVASALVPATEGRSSTQSSSREARSTASSLQSISSWLERSGENGWMGADVADVLEILRLDTESSVAAWQRAFRSGETLHLAQVSADERRDFILFMVKGPDERVYFYHSTVADGYKRGLVTAQDGRSVMPLGAEEGARGFREEVSYWESVISTR